MCVLVVWGGGGGGGGSLAAGGRWRLRNKENNLLGTSNFIPEK